MAVLHDTRPIIALKTIEQEGHTTPNKWLMLFVSWALAIIFLGLVIAEFKPRERWESVDQKAVYNCLITRGHKTRAVYTADGCEMINK